MDQELKRLKLHEYLVTILGTRYVYFDPPESLRIQYPCIIYELDGMDTTFADNRPHRITRRYQVTVVMPVTNDPTERASQNAVSDKIATLPMCTFSRSFPADNLNHHVYDLYF